MTTPLEALHELAWAIVLAYRGDARVGYPLAPPCIGETARRELARRAIALIEAQARCG